jgi:bla regulator protein blaR1
MKHGIRVGAAGLAIGIHLLAQGLKFEVASIKPSAPGAPGLMLTPMPLSSGEMRVSNITVKNLIMSAYNVRDFQVSGGPGWVNSERYDIVAKPERSANSENFPDDNRKLSDNQRERLQEQLRLRTQALLADRFHLEIHHESKEQPIYVLTADKNGPKLPETREGTEGSGQLNIGRGQLVGRGVPLRILVDMLSIQLNRIVRDQTGLQSKYDIRLEWTPDPGLGVGPLNLPPAPGAATPPPSNPDAPSLFAALQEQLGLRLESQKGPVDMIVIDRIERPSEN